MWGWGGGQNQFVTLGVLGRWRRVGGGAAVGVHILAVAGVGVGVGAVVGHGCGGGGGESPSGGGGNGVFGRRRCEKRARGEEEVPSA